jgi:non-heme chloroperoxidase
LRYKNNVMPQFTTTDGTTLFYKDFGTGRPLVFVHAAGMDSTFWDYTIPFLLAQGLRCIAYDKRGHGRSDVPGDGYDFDTLAGDLHGLLEKLDLYDVTLIGHSMGGAEIIRYHTLYGSAGRLSRVVFIGTPDCVRQLPDHPAGATEDQIAQRLEEIANDYPRWLDENIDAFFLQETFGTSDALKDWAQGMMQRTPVHVFVTVNRTVLAADLRAEVRKIRLPALVIHGDKDASIPFSCGESIAAAIPGSIFKAYAGAPHGLNLALKDRVNRDLAEFVK